MRSISTFLFLLCFGGGLLAQTPINQVIVAIGGNFSDDADFAMVAAYNPNNNNYLVFDSIATTSVQDVLIVNDVAYVVADTILRAYNIDSYTMLASEFVSGIRQLGYSASQNILVGARGFPVSSDYVKFYNPSTLAETASITGISGQCAGVEVVGDTAFVTVPGDFLSTVGSIAAVDLATPGLINEIALDSLGDGIGSIYFNDQDGSVYALASGAFGATTGHIHEIVPSNLNVTSTPLNFAVGNASLLDNGRMYGIFDGSFNQLTIDNASPFALADDPRIDGSWAANAYAPSSQEIFLTNTDFFSFGNLFRYDNMGVQQDSVAVGISPEALGVDSRPFTNVSDIFSEDIFIQTFPNPFVDRVTVDATRLKVKPEAIQVFDATGKLVFGTMEVQAQTEIELGNLPTGSYFLKVRTEVGDYAQIILRQ